MEKSKTYYGVRFTAEVIEEAYALFLSKLDESQKNPREQPGQLELEFGDESWSFDSIDEFFADYSKAERYRFDYIGNSGSIYTYPRIIIFGNPKFVQVSIHLSTKAAIENVFRVFERNLDRSKIQIESSPGQQITVFIGHGHSSMWRNLKDHLQDLHNIKVTAYEVGPRAGYTVKEVLEKMLSDSSFALLVLTGEDIDSEGGTHARENVIHEVGLFQGRLGFTRAIVLLEEGCNQFSNIYGLNQIKFRKGNIKEAFGDVVATIKREFTDEDE